MSPSMARALAWRAAPVLLSACATVAPSPTRVIEIDTPQFSGVHYPVPDALPTLAQPPPSPPDDPRLASAAALPPLPVDAETAPPQLRNAAVRDRETDMLTHAYLRWIEQVYRIVRQLSAGGAMAEPLALRRWHADSLGEMGKMTESAAALEGAFVDLAQELGVDLGGSTQEPGRAGRVRLLFRLTACVRRDLAERTRDGLDSLDARRRGIDDGQLRAELMASPARIDKQTDDLIRQTSASLQCAQLAGRALGGP